MIDIDGPTSFLIVSAAALLAALGCIALLVSIAALLIARFRRAALRAFGSGVVIGGLSCVTMLALLKLIEGAGEDLSSTFPFWGTIAALAGYGLGAASAIIMSAFWPPRIRSTDARA